MRTFQICNISYFWFMIWLASFPRSGNTFMRNIFYEVFGWESAAVNQKTIDCFSTHSEYPIVKTHLLPDQLQPNPSDTPVIYLVRDGRDALVSTAYHRSNIVEPGSPFLENLELAFEAAGHSYFGGWRKNVQSWLPKADLIIRFEDLITRPIDSIKSIESVFNVPATNYDRLPTFYSQRQGKHRYGPRLGKNEHFFRKGKVGEWKTEMPQGIQDQFWRKNQDLMTSLGYTKDGSLLPLDKNRLVKNVPKFNISKTILRSLNQTLHPARKVDPSIIWMDTGCDPGKMLAKLFDQPFFDRWDVRIKANQKLQLHQTTYTKQRNSRVVLCSNVSKYAVDPLLKPNSSPTFIALIDHPTRLVLSDYITHRNSTAECIIKKLNENDQDEKRRLRIYCRNYAHRNRMSKTISKFSDYLDFVGDASDPSRMVAQMKQKFDWAEEIIEPARITNGIQLINQGVIEMIERLNKKDCELYMHYHGQPDKALPWIG